FSSAPVTTASAPSAPAAASFAIAVLLRARAGLAVLVASGDGFSGLTLIVALMRDRVLCDGLAGESACARLAAFAAAASAPAAPVVASAFTVMVIWKRLSSSRRCARL